MELKGERVLPVDRATAWAALNNIDVLKAAVPGCESITLTAPNAYDVRVSAAIGPVKARFTGTLALADVQQPESYTLRFEMHGGAAGFARGEARVRLEAVDAQATQMGYAVNASIGGKLAQIGSRLVDAAAATMADKFFANFAAELANRHPAPAVAERASTGDAMVHRSPGLLATVWQILKRLFRSHS